MRNVYLFQPQYKYNNEKTVGYWLPTSVGTLWAYASQFKDITSNFCLKEMAYRRDPLNEVIARMDDPSVCGFSMYSWNREYILQLAELIKTTWPECNIIVGGPEVDCDLTSYNFYNHRRGGLLKNNINTNS